MSYLDNRFIKCIFLSTPIGSVYVFSLGADDASPPLLIKTDRKNEKCVHVHTYV